LSEVRPFSSIEEEEEEEEEVESPKAHYYFEVVFVDGIKDWLPNFQTWR
jgi:hypothetical protein